MRPFRTALVGSALSLLVVHGPASAQGVLPLIDHVHLAAPDPVAAVAWYKRHFGGEPMSEGTDRLLYGQARVAFSRRDNALPSAGGAVDHIGFSVPDIEATMKGLEADGAKITQPIKEVTGLFKLAFVEDPWGTKIEVVQDPETPGLHHIHLRGTDPAAVLAWYQERFPAGATGKLKGRIDGIAYGGVWLLVQRGEAAPSQGRSIDHIGFRPVDLQAVAATLKGRNVKFMQEPGPLTLASGAVVQLAFIEGPDGIRIELVQR